MEIDAHYLEVISLAVEVIMPKAGMAMEEGTISKWLKKEGEAVEAGEPLMEIETDKVNMEIEAPASGVLIKILNSEGDVVPVTQVIAYIGKEGEDIGASAGPEGKKGTETDRELQPRNIEKSGGGAEYDYDVIVIGGGPAGYISAIKAARLGARAALVEKDSVGGTCLNRGCIPTKTYLKNAEILHGLKNAADRGIGVGAEDVSIDMDRAVKFKNGIVKTLTSGVSGLLRSNGVKVYKGTGRILKDKSVQVGEERLTAGSIILAGGSKAARIKVPGIESPLVMTSDEILDLKEIPGNLAIIGGGVIGAEMAMVFSSYGSKVTIIEVMDRIVPVMDSEISLELKKSMEKMGIEILTSRKLESIAQKGNKLYLALDDGSLIEADRALLSIGRLPDLEGTGEIELELERGRIKVNEKMETSVEGIYAPGDINGRSMLAHAAFKMGETAAINAMGGAAEANLKNVPSCIYTIPEVGAVGLTEEEAVKKYDISVGRFPFAANGRALACGEAEGFVKVISDKKYGEILGVHIIGPCAAEMISEAAALIDMQATAHEIAEVIHGHPTFSEAFMEAAADSIGESLHLPKRQSPG